MNSSSSLAAELMAQLQGAPMQQMADQIGASPAQTESAVGAALPVLLGSLGRNAADPQGAANLFGALQRDHGAASGGAGGLDLGGLLGSLLGGGAGAGGNAGGGLDGAAILGHILGGNQQRAQDGLGQATGLGSGGAAQGIWPAHWMMPGHRGVLARPRRDGHPGDDQRRRARACNVPLGVQLSRQELQPGDQLSKR